MSMIFRRYQAETDRAHSIKFRAVDSLMCRDIRSLKEGSGYRMFRGVLDGMPIFMTAEEERMTEMIQHGFVPLEQDHVWDVVMQDTAIWSRN